MRTCPSVRSVYVDGAAVVVSRLCRKTPLAKSFRVEKYSLTISNMQPAEEMNLFEVFSERQLVRTVSPVTLGFLSEGSHD